MEQSSLPGEQCETDGLLRLCETADTAKLESALQALLLSDSVPESSLPGILDRLLIHSISHKLLSAVQVLINVGIEINGCPGNTGKGIPPLHVACEIGDIDIVKCLLQAGAQVNQRDTEGQSSLHIAVINGHSSIVEELLNYPVNFNMENSNGQTAVDVALEQKRLGIVTLLLDRLDKKTFKRYQENVERFAGQHGDITFMEKYIPVQFLKSKSKKRMERVNEICHQVCLHRNKEALEYLLSHGVNLGNKHNNTTAFHIACGTGCLAMVKLLLSACTIEVVDHSNRTPIYNAVEKKNTNIVRLLLHHRAEVNVSDENGKTPLHVAGALGNGAAIDLLLKYGADTNAQDNESYTTLMIVVARTVSRLSSDASLSLVHQRHIMKALLSHKADVNLVNSYGLTALHIATHHCNSMAMDMLLSAGADVNTATRLTCKYIPLASSPLTIAIRNTLPLSEAREPVAIEMVKILIKAGADIDSYIGKSHMTPLIVAIQSSNSTAARILLQSGCDVERPVTMRTGEQYTPLQYAVYQRTFDTAIELINRGAKVNILYKDHSTLLHQAITPLTYKADIVKTLLNSGVDVNVVNDNGESALHWFLRGKTMPRHNGWGPYYNIDTTSDLEALKAIIESPNIDFDVRYSETGDTPLIAAVRYAPKFREDIVRSILEQGANGNAVDCIGQTALHVAAAKGQLETVVILVEKGCDLNLRDSNSNTALDIAIMHRSESCSIYLVSKMADVHCLCDVLLLRSLSMNMKKLSKVLLERGCSVNAPVNQSLCCNGFAALSTYSMLCPSALSITLFNSDIDSMIAVLEAGFSVHQERDACRAYRQPIKSSMSPVEYLYHQPLTISASNPSLVLQRRNNPLHQIKIYGPIWLVVLSAGSMPVGVILASPYDGIVIPTIVNKQRLCDSIPLLCELLELGYPVNWEELEDVFSDSNYLQCYCNFSLLKATWVLPSLEVLAARCVRSHLFPNAWVSAHYLSLPQQLYQEHFGKFFESSKSHRVM